MSAICVGSVRRSKALLRLKWPQVEMIDPATFAVPPFSSAPSTLVPSSSTVGVTLDDIMEHLQRMHADFGGRLDYLTDEMSQMNTRIGCIARR